MGSGLSALAIIQSRAIWNDLLLGMTLTSSDSAHPGYCGDRRLRKRHHVELGP